MQNIHRVKNVKYGIYQVQGQNMNYVYLTQQNKATYYDLQL